MEIYKIEKDFDVVVVEAKTFPDGIEKAFRKLETILPQNEKRKFFGISYGGENGNIVYKAAAEKSYPGESEKYKLHSFTVGNGNYISETITNWRRDPGLIGNTFQKMLSEPNIKAGGYCLEMYINETDVVCLVPLEPEAQELKK